MLRSGKILALVASLYCGQVLAQGITPIGGGGGSGSGTVTNIATSCGVSGGPITTTGTISGITTVNLQSGTNYPIVSGDCGKLINLSNGSNQIPTIPSGATLGAGWFIEVCNQGVGTQTFTPAAGTIGGAATFVLAAGTAAAPKCTGIVSDGTNLQLDLAVGGGGSSSGANPTATASDTAVNGSASTFLRSDGAPAVQKGTNAQFGLAEGDNTSISMAAGVVSTKAFTGDCTTSAGAVAITCTKLNGVLYGAFHPGFISSNWYAPWGLTPAIGATLTASTVYCYPFIVPPGGMTIKSLGVNVTTSNNGSNVSFAIYNNSTGHRPGTKLDDIGSTGITLTASTGAYNHAVANTTDLLAAGSYWGCSSDDNATPAFAAVTAAASGAGVGSLIGSATLTSAINTSSNEIAYVSCTAGTTCQGASFAWSGTTFAWPADLTSSTWADGGASRAPMIALQVN